MLFGVAVVDCSNHECTVVLLQTEGAELRGGVSVDMCMCIIKFGNTDHIVGHHVEWWLPGGRQSTSCRLSSLVDALGGAVSCAHRTGGWSRHEKRRPPRGGASVKQPRVALVGLLPARDKGRDRGRRSAACVASPPLVDHFPLVHVLRIKCNARHKTLD